MKRKKRTFYFLSWLVLMLPAFLTAGCGPGDRQFQARVVVGQPVPEFALTDIKGRKWNLADLRGKVVLINFWATWCSPCREEMPSMEALNRRLPDTSFQMLTILYNDRPEFAYNLAKKIEFTAPIIVDTGSELATQYGLTGVPETFIIDTRGVLREKFIGPQKWDSPDVIAMLEQYLPQSLTQAGLKGDSNPLSEQSY